MYVFRFSHQTALLYKKQQQQQQQQKFLFQIFSLT